MIFELDVMPVAFQSLVSSYPICDPSENGSRKLCEWVQREAIAGSADDNLEFSQQVSNWEE